MKFEHIGTRFRIDKPDDFHLADHDPAGNGGLTFDKGDGKAMLKDGLARLGDLQQKFYADDRWSLLIVLQGMDAAGKDSTISHVMSGLNPQGVEVHPFKQPSQEELDHDFLWRIGRRLPERGRIGIFNRSHYEEVTAVRVHPELLARQKLPPQLAGDEIWEERFDDIRAFERHLARSGTVVLKFFLNVSKDEQRKRFLDRLDEPSKNWKFSMGDVAERKRWPEYMAAYEAAIRATSQPEAPWYVIPADHKWFARLAIASAVVQSLESLNLAYPTVEGEALKNLDKARKALLAEKP